MTELLDDSRLTAIVDGLLAAADAPVTTDEDLADAIFTAEFNGHMHIGRYLRARLAKRHTLAARCTCPPNVPLSYTAAGVVVPCPIHGGGSPALAMREDAQKP